MSIRHATAAALVGLSLATPSDLSAAAPFSCVWLRTGAPAASMSGAAGATAVERASGSAVSTIRRFVSWRPPAMPFRLQGKARSKNVAKAATASVLADLVRLAAQDVRRRARGPPPRDDPEAVVAPAGLQGLMVGDAGRTFA